MPVIIFVTTIFTTLSLSAGKAAVHSIVDEELAAHIQSEPSPHKAIVELKTSQAVILNRLSAIEVALGKNSDKTERLSEQIVSIKIEQKSISDKLDQLLTQNNKPINR